LAVATIALSTFSGIDEDVASSAAKLPAVIALALSTISGFGQFVLPLVITFALLNAKRARLLGESIAAFVAASVVIALMINFARDLGSQDFWYALSGTLDRDAVPLQPLFAGVVAFVTVARLRGQLSTFSTFILASTLIADSVSGGFTVTALIVSLLSGYAIGLAFRYAIGTPTVRPKGVEIAQALSDAGINLSTLRAVDSTKHGRRYLATTDDEEKLFVVVFDRDLEGAGVLPRWWRSLRLRDNEALGGWSMREAVERSSLMALAATNADAPVPQLHLVRRIGDDATVLVYEWIDGVSGTEFIAEGKTVTKKTLKSAWVGLKKLHDSGIAHRGISAEHLLIRKSGKVTLVHITSGTVAMSDLQARIDIADMAIALASLSTAEEAIRVGEKVFGKSAMMSALPALQKFALSLENRKALRRNKATLGAVREAIAALAPGEEIAQVEIERIQPRKALTIGAAFVAGYLLLGQLANVNLVEIFVSADWQWVSVVAIAVLAMFVGSAMTLDGFVVEKLPFYRTFQVQIAGAFVTLVSPPALGSVAVNGRYLQKSGLSAAATGATIAVSQVLAFLVHIFLLFAAGVAAGSEQDFIFEPPREAVIAVGVFALVAIIVLPLPFVRKYIVDFARPRITEVLPRFVTLGQRPMKLFVGISGMVIMNVALCVALIASVRAFDGGGTWAAISLVYLAGSTLGMAAPTPGGIGAMETVMTAGLVAAGVNPGIALSAVLLYRLVSFWLPTIPGWIAFRQLMKRELL
jgi:uncharacterized protein (TIRG00374 family)